MRVVSVFGIALLAIVAFSQPVSTPPPEAALGIAPRSSPAEYPVHVPVGKFTLAAEFTGHNLNTLQGNLHTEDYVVIEVAAFGDEHLTLSLDDFSLRVNGSKKALVSQQYSFILPSLRDLDWEANITPVDDKKEKHKETAADLTAPPPPPPLYPTEIRREMADRARKAQLPLGDRALPQAGLLFFPYSGRADKLRSIELFYNGPAGQAILKFRQ